MGRRTHPGIVAVVCLFAGVAVAADKAKTEKPRLAVVDFKVLGDVGIKDAGRTVAELLLTRFDTEKYQLVERAHLVKILEEHKLTMADIVSNPALVQRKKLKGVRHLVVGSVVKFGKLRITARVVDMTTGHIGRKAEVSASDADGLADKLTQLAGILSGKKPAPTTKPLPAAFTPLTLTLGGGVTMKLVLIPAGKFRMGSGVSAEQLAKRYEGAKAEQFTDEFPQREVTITKPFYMGITEVTQAQWQAVMGTKPRGVREGAENPVSSVLWKEATAFCEKLSQKTARTIRLPTEAEWEYACRAGSKTRFCFGDEEWKLGDYAWYRKNTWKDGERHAHAVGRKKPNAWGLYDMHGNVHEWCRDFYDKKFYAAGGNSVDPTGPAAGYERVGRGGFFLSTGVFCRSSLRGSGTNVLAYAGGLVGFRVVSPLVGPKGRKRARPPATAPLPATSPAAP